MSDRKTAEQKEADRVRNKDKKEDSAEERSKGAGERKKRSAKNGAPGARQKARHEEGNIGGLRAREIPAYVISLAMALLMLLQSTELKLPELLRDESIAGVAMLAMHLAVILLGIDVILSGFKELFTLRPGRDTLVMLANAAVLADCVMMPSFWVSPYGRPYCAAAALSVAFSISGRRLTRQALRYGLRTTKAARVPTVICSESGLADEGPVLVKRLGNYHGFVQRMRKDPVESLYRVMTPVIVFAVVGLSVILYRRNGEEALLHGVAGMLAASASVFASVCYGRPFKTAAKKLALFGSAAAGWSGAKEIGSAAGMVIRDEDIYPENTVSVSGMRVVSGGSVEKAIAYTGSLILASGSGLKKVFDALMLQYNASLCRPEDFQYGIEGGISASVGGERVMVGTLDYMQTCRISVPEELRAEGAVYTAVNRELTAVFYLEYRSLTPIGTALRSVIGSRLNPIFAFRNFTVNAEWLTEKFRLGRTQPELLPVGDRYKLSVDRASGQPAAAVMTREGIGHYINIVRTARKLARSVRRSLFMLVLGTAGGLTLMFFSFLARAYEAASAWNLFAFLLLWALASMLFADNASER